MIVASSDNLPYEQIGKGEPVCIADEVSFDIPDSWEWIRLGSFSTYADTKKKVKASVADKNIWGLDLEDIEKGGRLISKKKVGERKATGDKTIFEEGDILYSKLRPYLLKIMIADESGICTPEIVPFKVFGNINPEYIVLYLKSPCVDDVINSVTYGVKMPRVGTGTMTGLFVPLPPLNEQKRIVDKINEVIPAVESYGKKENESNNLQKEFPNRLKKSILQWAIQGKLVPQDPTDEPASVLLERIREEKARLVAEGKIKKDKNESIIYRRDNSHYEELDGREQCIDDEIPFDIPASWEWRRLRSIAKLQTGTTPPTGNRDYFGSGFPFIKPGDISLSGIDYCNESLTELGSKKSRLIPQESVLMVCIGGSIGKCYYTDRDVCCNQQINAASPIFINHKYLWIVLSNDYVNKCIIATAGGTATPIINKSLWGELLIPIPPLNEQVQIVSIVEALETSIKIL